MKFLEHKRKTKALFKPHTTQCYEMSNDSPVRVGPVPSDDELEFRQAAHRDAITAGGELKQLPLLFLQEVVANLPEVSGQKSSHLKIHSSQRHIFSYTVVFCLPYCIQGVRNSV